MKINSTRITSAARIPTARSRARIAGRAFSPLHSLRSERALLILYKRPSGVRLCVFVSSVERSSRFAGWLSKDERKGQVGRSVIRSAVLRATHGTRTRVKVMDYNQRWRKTGRNTTRRRSTWTFTNEVGETILTFCRVLLVFLVRSIIVPWMNSARLCAQWCSSSSMRVLLLKKLSVFKYEDPSFSFFHRKYALDKNARVSQLTARIKQGN